MQIGKPIGFRSAQVSNAIHNAIAPSEAHNCYSSRVICNA
jgi:hypothetical protein